MMSSIISSALNHFMFEIETETKENCYLAVLQQPWFSLGEFYSRKVRLYSGYSIERHRIQELYTD